MKKKSPEFIEFQKSIEFKPNALGVMRPTKLFSRKKETEHRSTFGKKRSAPRHMTSLRLDLDLYEYVVNNRGDVPVSRFINELIRKGAGL